MFNESKYTILYYSIIKNRQDNPADEYTESHHIIPKSLGGTDDQSNLVSLTPREHFICHRLLTKMTVGRARQKMFLALACFTKPMHNRPDVKITSKVFDECRKQSNEYLKEINKGIAHRPAGTYNHSQETKDKMSASAKGIVKRPKGYKHNESTIALMKENRKGKGKGNIPWNKGLKQTCPHCGKVVGGTLNIWHGDRCRFKSESSE